MLKASFTEYNTYINHTERSHKTLNIERQFSTIFARTYVFEDCISSKSPICHKALLPKRS